MGERPRKYALLFESSLLVRKNVVPRTPTMRIDIRTLENQERSGEGHALEVSR